MLAGLVHVVFAVYTWMIGAVGVYPLPPDGHGFQAEPSDTKRILLVVFQYVSPEAPTGGAAAYGAALVIP
jgi:hypothetical protein